MRLHGVPAEVISDCGSLSTSMLWPALCVMTGTKQGSRAVGWVLCDQSYRQTCLHSCIQAMPFCK
jgi:hypothetical protein